MFLVIPLRINDLTSLKQSEYEKVARISLVYLNLIMI